MPATTTSPRTDRSLWLVAATFSPFCLKLALSAPRNPHKVDEECVGRAKAQWKFSLVGKSGRDAN
jgi:hypothetical protein